MTYTCFDRSDLFDGTYTVKDIHVIQKREVRGHDYLLSETNNVANKYYFIQCLVRFEATTHHINYMNAKLWHEYAYFESLCDTEFSAL